MDFEFYGFVKYIDNSNYPVQQQKLGRWLGIIHEISSPMTYWVLKENDKVMPTINLHIYVCMHMHTHQFPYSSHFSKISPSIDIIYLATLVSPCLSCL